MFRGRGLKLKKVKSPPNINILKKKAVWGKGLKTKKSKTSSENELLEEKSGLGGRGLK